MGPEPLGTSLVWAFFVHWTSLVRLRLHLGHAQLIQGASVPLGKLDVEDKRKIHNEITQLGSQRLQITGFAMALFGVIGALLVPKSPPSGCVGAFTYIAAIVLTCLLFALYLFSHLLRNLLRIYSTYLIVTNESKWEHDWERYRTRGYIAYTKAQTVLFLFLGMLSTALPLGLGWIYGLAQEPRWGLWADGIAGGVYVVLVWGMGFLKRWSPDGPVKARWIELQKPRASVIGLGEYFRKLRPGISTYLQVEQLIDERQANTLELHSDELAKFSQIPVGYGELSIDKSVDCIMLLTPPSIHVRQLEHLVNSSKTVFVEKPLAIHASEIPRIRSVASRNPRLYCSDHYVDVRAVPLLSWLFRGRYRPLAARLSVSGNADLWQLGPEAFGKLENVEAKLLEYSGFEGRPWLNDVNNGGVVLDLMYHFFALCAHIFEENLAVDKVVLKSRQRDGELVPWKPQLGGETYARTEGHVGPIPFSCEVGKYWPKQVRSFTLHYSAGEASMLFEARNTLILKTRASRCAIVLGGSDYEHVVARFTNYLGFEPNEPHGLSEAIRAIEAADRVKQLARSALVACSDPNCSLGPT